MGWLIALGVLVLLGCLPLGISAVYNEYGIFLRLIAGVFRITVFPNRTAKKRKREKPKKTQPTKAKTADKQISKTGGNITDFLPLLQIVLDLLTDFRRKLRVNRLEMKMILAGGDPCNLSINYGRAWTALGNLMPLLERVFVIKNRDLEIECDYISDKTVIYARIDLTITLGRLLVVSMRHGFRALIQYIKITNQRKGGAEQ